MNELLNRLIERQDALSRQITTLEGQYTRATTGTRSYLVGALSVARVEYSFLAEVVTQAQEANHASSL